MGIREVVTHQYRQIVDEAAEATGDVTIPPEGWVTTARKSLGMTGAQLARRLGMSRSQVLQTERNELSGGATLKTLQKVADALGYRLVYAIVPATTAEEVLRSRARGKAKALVDASSEQMALEGQALSGEQIEYEITRLENDMVREPPSTFWNDE